MADNNSVGSSRRDMLFLATGAVGAVGVAGAAWPLISQMNPDASTLSLAVIEVDLTPIPVGQTVTVKWQGKPVFIRHRGEEEIKEVRAVDAKTLIDPASDESRVKKPEWLVVVGVCTHLGCVPQLDKENYQGWACPCHGSLYDASGRVRRGPAPLNLDVPKYVFLSDTKIAVGTDVANPDA